MTTSIAPSTPEAIADSGGVAGELRGYLARLRGGDTGSVPAVLGLVVLVGLFTILQRGSFATKGNFANLITQSAPTIFIAMGLVFVLLLGEIDLSAGFTAGTAAAVLGVLMTQRGVPWWIATPASLATGAVIGLLIGLLVARLGIPSFVVTLAGLLAFQGLQLQVLGDTGTVNHTDPAITNLASTFLPRVKCTNGDLSDRPTARRPGGGGSSIGNSLVPHRRNGHHR